MVPIVAPHRKDVLAGPERGEQPDRMGLESWAVGDGVLDLGAVPLGDQLDRVAGETRRAEIDHLIAVEDTQRPITIVCEIDQPHPKDAT